MCNRLVGLDESGNGVGVREFNINSIGISFGIDELGVCGKWGIIEIKLIRWKERGRMAKSKVTSSYSHV